MSGGAVRPRLPAEFKSDAVSMVIDGQRTVVDVARGLGLVPGRRRVTSWRKPI